VTTVYDVAIELALDEANAGRPPHLQDRDLGHLVRVVCAWCNNLMRYEMWPEADDSAEGGELRTSHGMCHRCRQRMEAR
jgi:hypothetical protein